MYLQEVQLGTQNHKKSLWQVIHFLHFNSMIHILKIYFTQILIILGNLFYHMQAYVFNLYHLGNKQQTNNKFVWMKHLKIAWHKSYHNQQFSKFIHKYPD
jgi:hypothetical protein